MGLDRRVSGLVSHHTNPIRERSLVETRSEFPPLKLLGIAANVELLLLARRVVHDGRDVLDAHCIDKTYPTGYTTWRSNRSQAGGLADTTASPVSAGSSPRHVPA